LGGGALSGKYLGGARPEGARSSIWPQYFGRYLTENGIKATEAYVKLAKDNGLDPAQMALAYVNTRPFLTANIIGATSMEQLKSNIGSAYIELSDDVLAEIEKIHTTWPNPCP
jgi:aryl-alcohol dehydrogenase-like predicted oxidoreductase